jgi:hypothetical protein
MLLLWAAAGAQAPQGIPYQAAARNSGGGIMASTAISVRFSIRDSVAAGAILYREVHSVTTTPQGLFSVQIGSGSPVSGTFAGINWGAAPRYLQVEMDPTGGSTYTDMGTTQMMSVPYALYSNNGLPPVTATGDILYSNGTSWQKLPAGIEGQVLTMSGGLPVWAGCPMPFVSSITGTATVATGNTTTLASTTAGGVWSSSNTAIATVNTDGMVTGVASGTTTISYTVTNACGAIAAATRIVTVSSTTISIGDSYGGGIIFYILHPGEVGYVTGEVHGLIAAPTDQSVGMEWGCSGTMVGGTSTDAGSGAANTSLVADACGAGTAARLCNELELGGYSDWYLPSLEELDKLYNHKDAVGGFTSGYYWSSSEYTENFAWIIYFYNGGNTYDSKSTEYYVRAIRYF